MCRKNVWLFVLLIVMISNLTLPSAARADNETPLVIVAGYKSWQATWQSAFTPEGQKAVAIKSNNSVMLTGPSLGLKFGTWLFYASSLKSGKDFEFAQDGQKWTASRTDVDYGIGNASDPQFIWLLGYKATEIGYGPNDTVKQKQYILGESGSAGNGGLDFYWNLGLLYVAEYPDADATGQQINSTGYGLSADMGLKVNIYGGLSAMVGYKYVYTQIKLQSGSINDIFQGTTFGVNYAIVF